MRIVIDIQGMQSESRYRGIGRYVTSLLDAFVEINTDHDIVLIANAAFPQSVVDLRYRYAKRYANCDVAQWHGVYPVAARSKENQTRAAVSRCLFLAFVDTLKPDVFLCSSVFEGYIDDAITVIPSETNRDYLCAAIVYDLIPLRMPESYLTDEQYAAFYKEKLSELDKLDLCLTISDFSKSDIATSNLLNNASVVNISAGRDACFKSTVFNADEKQTILAKYSIEQPYLLYVGAGDTRKNLQRMVKAFACTPSTITKKFQLVLAGQIHTAEELLEISRAEGVRNGALRILSYVPDNDLPALYSCSDAVIAPSLYEGFGLTILEAMACGVPAICSNTTSLKEIIDNPAATFDPLDTKDMAARITTVLTDNNFRIALVQTGLERVKSFTWELSAASLLKALEEACAAARREPPQIKDLTHQENVSALLRDIVQVPDVHEWSDASLITLAQSVEQNHPVGSRQRTLFVDVSELSQRDSGTGVQRVTRSLLHQLVKDPPRGYVAKPVYGSIDERGYKYAHQYGNKIFGDGFYPTNDSLIEYDTGDIFLGVDLQHHVIRVQEDFYHQMSQKGVQVWFVVYDLLPIQFPDFWEPQHNVSQIHIDWLKIVSSFSGVLCISNAVSNELKQWLEATAHPNKSNLKVEWFHLGADFEPGVSTKGLPADAGLVISRLCSTPSFLMVGTIEPRKGHADVLDAAEKFWGEGREFSLVVVGGRGWFVEGLLQRFDTHPQLNRKLFLLNGVSDEYLDLIYEHSDCLIAASLGEGFGLPLIEAAQRGLSVLCRDIPVFREVAEDHALYFGGEHTESLVAVMGDWLNDCPGKSHVERDKLRWLTWKESSNTLKGALVKHELPRQQLLVDVSELVKFDAKTGIQRVVCNILGDLLVNPPKGHVVSAVYACDDSGYRYANEFTHSFLNLAGCAPADDHIHYASGDVFLGLDLQPQIVPKYRGFYNKLRRQGVSVHFVVYDLLPVLSPCYFPDGVYESFVSWLETVLENDEPVCISEAVASELKLWVAKHRKDLDENLFVKTFSLGANFVDEKLDARAKGQNDAIVTIAKDRCSFLMVGTIEPRKAHAQVLDAFELLWAEGLDASLLIVGKRGWMADSVCDRLLDHVESGKRLFWLEGISDIALKQVYEESTCLIAASYCEGFGLPLIEAAHHALPIIARNLPVFKEVAGEGAYYFEGQTPTDIQRAVKTWLGLYETNKHPSPNIEYLSWAESTRELLYEIEIS